MFWYAEERLYLFDYLFAFLKKFRVVSLLISVPVYCFYVFFTCLGAMLALEMVWHYGDLAMGCMTVPNLIAVLLLSPVIAKITKDYLERHKKKKNGMQGWKPYDSAS